MSTASTRIPQPKDWQEFERQIERLAQCWLNDPNAKGNGRPGQRQNGVDVFGWRDGKLAVGFQCKEKFDKRVTEEELLQEIKKAERFRPELSEFILVTTAPRDVKLQEAARVLTSTRDTFSIEVWGWEDIEQIVARYPEAMRAFDPAYNPIIAEELREHREQSSADHALLLAEVRELKATLQGGRAVIAEISVETDTSTELHGQITFIQSMIDDGEVLAAKPLLDRLITKEFEKASPNERYRIRVAQANIAIKSERFEDAGVLLIDAAETNPAGKNASMNLAMGYLLTGDGEKAERAAADVLSSDPKNQKMAETMAQARAQQGKEDLFEGIDQSLLNSSVIWGLRSSLARVAGDENWKEICREGLAEHPDDKFLRRFAAEATIDDCVSDAPAFVIGEPTKGVSYEQVQDAADELCKQIEVLRSMGGEVSPILAHNAAVACRLVDRFDDALEILKAAIVDHPEEQSLVEQVALDLVHRGDPSEAAALLENAERTQRGDLTLAASLIELNKLDEAKALLDQMPFPTGEDGLSFQYLGVHLEWFRTKKHLDDARVFFASVAKAYKKSPLVHLFRAKVERLTGDDTAHAKAVTEAAARIADNTSFAVIYELADEAFRAQQYELAVDLLRGRVSLDYENQPLSLCIAAAMNGDLLKTASDLLEGVPSKVADQRWYRRVKAALANKIGSDKALPLLNSYLNDFPDDVEIRTSRIGLWQTIGQMGKIRKEIEKIDFDALQGSPFNLMQFFRIATAYSDGTKAVPRAYKLLLENWNDVDCHTGYHGLFLANERIKGIQLAPQQIQSGCAFKVRTEKKGERWLRIEEERPAVFGEEWLSPADELAMRFLGKSAGETISIDGAYGDSSSEILEVKSVYLDTFHRSLHYFNERFPDSGAMLQLSVDTKADDPFAEMKQITRRMSERNEQVLNLYRDNPIPIVWLSSLLGKDEIECSVGIPAEMGIPFRVCQGTSEEREAAFEVIENNAQQGVIVDAVSAVLIKRLGVQDAVEAVCGPLKTTSTTIERLAERFHEAESMLGRSMGSFGYRDGQYFLTEYSKEEQRVATEVRKAELEWAREHVEVVPSLPQADLDKDARQIADLVGMRAIAPAIAANGSGLPLFADDFGIRIWAKSALNVDGLWLQPILMKARDGGHLSEDEYAAAVLNIVEAGFSYVSLDTRTLLFALKRANFDVAALVRPLQILLGKPADLSRNLLIAISLVVTLDREKCPRMTKLKLLSEIARAACYPRWDHASEILSGIAAAIPGDKKLIRLHLQRWYWWNSIGQTDRTNAA